MPEISRCNAISQTLFWLLNSDLRAATAH